MDPSKDENTEAHSGDVHRHATDDDDRKRKRLRVSNACDGCRKRKERCDGTRPSCLPCQKTNRHCSYAPSKRRGLPAGYVHGVEVLLGLLLHTFEPAGPLILSILRGDDGFHQLVSRGTLPVADSLISVWRTSPAAKELERSLYSANGEDDDPFAQNIDYKLTAALNMCLSPPETEPAAEASDLSLDDAPQILYSFATNTEPSDLILADNKNLSPILDLGNDGSTESRPRLHSSWPRLLEIYTANTHCWFPIIQPHTLFRSSGLLSGDSPHDNTEYPTPGQQAALWAVLSLASYQASTMAPISGSGYSQDPDSASYNQLRLEARALASKEQSSYEIEHVQAFLILALCGIGEGNWTCAWLWMGKAIYTAIDLQIVPKYQDQGSRNLDESQKRVLYGCFLLDTLVSKRLHRRPHLRTQDIPSIGDIRTESLEEWDVWKPVGKASSNGSVPGRILSTFNNFVRLVALLNDSLWLSEDHSNASNLVEIIGKLDSWKKRIPQMEHVLDTEGFKPVASSPHTMNLTLAFTSIYIETMALNAPHQSLKRNNTLSRKHFGDITNFLKGLSAFDDPFGPAWMPPVFEIYISSLEFSLSNLDWASTGSINSVALILQHLRKFWKPPINQEPGAQSYDGMDDRRVWATSMSQRSHRSATEANKQQCQPSIAQMESVNDRPGIVTDAVELAARRGDPYVGGQDDGSNLMITPSSENDILFNTMTSLDVTNWSGFSDEFMENLGFQGNPTNIDISSLFSPP